MLFLVFLIPLVFLVSSLFLLFSWFLVLYSSCFLGFLVLFSVFVFLSTEFGTVRWLSAMESRRNSALSRGS